MNQKDIYDIILKHNLYPWQTKTYVEPFSDGSYFFWNKPISFTQYINDVNKRICNFYLQIRNGNYDKANILFFYSIIINVIFQVEIEKKLIFQRVFSLNHFPVNTVFCSMAASGIMMEERIRSGRNGVISPESTQSRNSVNMSLSPPRCDPGRAGNVRVCSLSPGR